MESEKILAIDPGNIESAYCLIDKETKRPIKFDKVENSKVLELIKELEYDTLVIEMIASYGMGVGATVFETCVWIGRYKQIALDLKKEVEKVFRKDVKINLCRSMKAKDGNIMQALIDRFAPNVRNKGKGIKSDQGWFYGFKADIWQAYAVGITYLDLNKK